MLCFVLFFLLGDMAVQIMSSLPDRSQLIVMLLLALVTAKARAWPVTAFCIGFVWTAMIAQAVLDDRLAPALEGKLLTIQGVVADIPLRNEERVRFGFTPLNDSDGLPEKIRLSWYYPKKRIKAGQIWRLPVKLKRPHGYFNPNGFDYEKWLLSRHIGATGYVRKSPEPQLLGPSSYYLLRWRQHIADWMDENIQHDLTRGIVKALSIGDRSDISPSQWMVFRRTGTAHLMAISGLHIGLIAGMVYAVLRRAMLWLPGPKDSYRVVVISLSVLAAGLYAALAGFSLPTRRALIMLVIVMLALSGRRHVKKMQIVALALMVVLLLDPLAVLSAGFWLSFLAVIVILTVVSGRIKKERFYRAALRVHVAAALGLLPILALFFQQFSMIAPLANIVAVPVITLVVVPLIFCLLLLVFCGTTLLNVLLDGLQWILQLLWHYLAGLSQWHWAVYDLNEVGIVALVLALFGIGLFLLPRGTPGRHLSAVMMLPLFFPAMSRPPNGEIRLALLDVGQGLSIVVETQRHTLLFDAGARYGEYSDKGQMVVLPYLQFRGIDRLDGIIISHGDNDHIGGVFSVLEVLPYFRVLSSVPEKLSQFGAEFCQAGQQWHWDDVSFSLLSPSTTHHLDSENNRSCVLMIETRQFTFLLPGDIEQPAENWLLKRYGQSLTADVLIAPHHGSKTSSGEAFLQQLKPDYVLIPAGYRNRFGFPHAAVLQRYQKWGIDWLTTAEAGAVIVETENNRLNITASRKTAGHYWMN
jgi:competence protein ComEC